MLDICPELVKAGAVELVYIVYARQYQRERFRDEIVDSAETYSQIARASHSHLFVKLASQQHIAEAFC
jgi:hypothetical protein